MDRRNRIILLIDFSEYSENLTNFAFEFSELINAKVVLVHRIPGMAPAMADLEVREEVVKAETEEAHSRLRKLANGRVYSHDSFQVSHLPVLSILQNLESEVYFDWVLVGLKSTGPLKRVFIGNTTLSIIDDSDYLTVAIPARNRVLLPHKLMVGLSPKYPLNRTQFKIVLSALDDQIKNLEFFTILKKDEDEPKAKEHLLEIQTIYEAYKPNIQLYKGEHALGLLKSRMELSQDSFLVLQQGSRTLNDKLFRKFMINELVYSGRTPLIVLSK